MKTSIPVTFRELNYSDLIALNQWRNDPEIMYWLGNNFIYISSDIDKVWLDKYYQEREKNYRLAIIANEIYVGNINLTNIHSINRSAEVSLLIGNKNYWGKGIGTQALEKIVKYAFLDLNLYRLYLTVLEYNRKAISIYEKTGFDVEGIMKDAMYKEGNFHNMVLMGRLNK